MKCYKDRLRELTKDQLVMEIARQENKLATARSTLHTMMEVLDEKTSAQAMATSFDLDGE